MHQKIGGSEPADLVSITLYTRQELPMAGGESARSFDSRVAGGDLDAEASEISPVLDDSGFPSLIDPHANLMSSRAASVSNSPQKDRDASEDVRSGPRAMAGEAWLGELKNAQAQVGKSGRDVDL